MNLPAGDKALNPGGLTELVSDWYWEQDDQFRFTTLSTGFADRTGLDASAYLGRKRWEVLALNLGEADWNRHCVRLERNEPFREFEIQRVGAHGRSVWISESGEPVLDEAGHCKGYRGFGRDITAQKRVAEVLKLERTVAVTLANAASAAEGLQAALRAICELEGWDAGRCFRVDPASGALTFLEGWFAHVPAIEQFLQHSRVLWQAGKTVSSSDLPKTGARPAPAESGRGYATFAFPAVAQSRTIAMLTFSGHSGGEPDQSLLEAAPALGSLFAQFLQRKEAEEALRESESRFRNLTQLSSDFFWETDTEHRISSLVHGPSLGAALAGRGVVGQAPWRIPSVSPDPAGWAAHKALLESHLPFRDFEFARTMRDGTIRSLSVSGQPRFDSHGHFLGYRGVGRDVTEIALARERIASLAYRDALTGLANRISLVPAIEHAVQRARRRGTRIAGVFVDLDGFKQINDLHGHAAGDAFLVEVGRRLRSSLRATDMVARLGGDEFFVVLEEVQDTDAIERVLGKLVSGMLRPYELAGGAKAYVSASLGVSIFPDDAGDTATLMEHADKAMYTAKKAGKNAYCLYSSGEHGAAPEPTPLPKPARP